MTTHARLSPSSSKRWLACPGSPALSDGIEDRPTFYAAEGSAAHELLEWALTSCLPMCGGVGRDLADRIGETWTHDGFSGTVDRDMVDAVQVAVDYVRGRLAEHPGAELHLERRVNFDRLSPPEGLDGGTADVTIWYGPGLRNLEVIDYKHGAGVFVEVQDNPQTLQYALGAVCVDGRRPAAVRTTIVQPRHHGDEPVRSADYTWEDLVAFKKDLFAGAEATSAPDAPLVPGDHCRFCLAHAVCPAQAGQAVALAQADFEELAEGGAEILADPQLLTPEDLGTVLKAAGFVEDWISSVRAHVADLLRRGVEVPGWKQVRGTAHRKWADEERADQYLARKGFGVDDRQTRKLVSPAQAEKLLKREGLKTTYIQRFIVQPEGAPKLAPADDPRPALPSSTEADFGDLTNDPHTGEA